MTERVESPILPLVGTHDGLFHCDDAVAYAILFLLHSKGRPGLGQLPLVRSRDPEQLRKCKILFDVGGEYVVDQAAGVVKLDHHQRGGAGARANGIPYAAAGLTWKTFGQDISTARLHDADIYDRPADGFLKCTLAAQRVFDRVDENFIAPIDAADTGFELYTGLKVPNVRPLTLSSVVASSNFLWDAEPSPDDIKDRFIKVSLGLCLDALVHALDSAIGVEKARGLVREAEFVCDGRALVLGRFCPWQDEILSNMDYADVLYVIYKQAGEGRETWMVQCVPDAPGSFGKRKALPAAWGGLRDEKFSQEAGIPDGIFCHPGLFLCGARSRASAIKLAETARWL